jgi:2,5-diketo-D-gluconate reductase B
MRPGGVSSLSRPGQGAAGLLRQRHGTGGLQPIANGRIKNDKALAGIGEKHRKSAAQVCLRWLLQQNVAAIPRTSKIERLSENIDLFDFELSDEEMRQISAMGSAKGRLTDFGFAPKWD